MVPPGKQGATRRSAHSEIRHTKEAILPARWPPIPGDGADRGSIGVVRNSAGPFSGRHRDAPGMAGTFDAASVGRFAIRVRGVETVDVPSGGWRRLFAARLENDTVRRFDTADAPPA